MYVAQFTAILVLLAPTYVVRFGIFGAPANLLLFFVIALWVYSFYFFYSNREYPKIIEFIKRGAKGLNFPVIFTGLFFLAGLISLFVGGYSLEKFGQYMVLFLQPISVFVLAKYFLSDEGRKQKFVKIFLDSIYIFIIASGIYAIVQYFTLIGVPEAWWGNSVEPKRALAFFMHPNFFALFVTPLLAFVMPDLYEFWKTNRWRGDWWNKLKFISWFFGVFGLLLSMSRGGWLAFAFVALVFLLAAGNRVLLKFSIIALVVGFVFIFSIPNFRYRLLLPFQGEKSAVSRLSLLDTARKEIKVSPLAGLGLTGFSSNWDKFNTDPGLTHHPTPHNLYAALWVDLGILGLISFLGLAFLAILRGLRKNKTKFQFGLALAVVAILTHGLVDTPYMKNDLAMLFWLMYSFI